MAPELPFWKQKSLHEFSTQEWEALCDGCGRCCVAKLEDMDTGELHYTNVACRLLDLETTRCGDYKNRFQRVPLCVKLTPDNLSQIPYLPSTCSYRLVYEGKDLPSWHPLISHQADSTFLAGICVGDKVISEDDITEDELEWHIVDWIK
ncbi:MAG TPA: YcgN family cysteine cluster protein [Gammaproteobacteria bacterium]|nr:YcgN family cysteine cluster protein [Gammaproteobacteria bacterium]